MDELIENHRQAGSFLVGADQDFPATRPIQEQAGKRIGPYGTFIEAAKRDGIVVFRAASGDLLAGIATWEIEPAVDASFPGSIHFSWRDSVEFGDGTIVHSTGRFASQRPPGLIICVIFIFGVPIFS